MFHGENPGFKNSKVSRFQCSGRLAGHESFARLQERLALSKTSEDNLKSQKPTTWKL
jgi:hypothetical protein